MSVPQSAGDTPDHTEARRELGAPGWSEHHRLLAVEADDRDHITKTGIAVQIGIHSDDAHNAASFHCAVFRHREDPLVIVESEIDVPDRLWEFRTSGLWADTICETPYEHWSYGLEAFALAIQDPREMLGRGYGDRVPLGWELEFEGDPGLVRAEASGTGFSQTGQAHGLLLLAAGEVHEFSGRALRQHWWGEHASAALPSLDAQAALLDLGGPESIDPDQVWSEVVLPLDSEQLWELTVTNVGIRSASPAA